MLLLFFCATRNHQLNKRSMKHNLLSWFTFTKMRLKCRKTRERRENIMRLITAAAAASFKKVNKKAIAKCLRSRRQCYCVARYLVAAFLSSLSYFFLRRCCSIEMENAPEAKRNAHQNFFLPSCATLKCALSQPTNFCLLQLSLRFWPQLGETLPQQSQDLSYLITFERVKHMNKKKKK